MQNRNSEVNFTMITIFQYVFSILVIMLHARKIFPNEAIHFVQKSVFSRMAVPFFIISSIYFMRMNFDVMKVHPYTHIKKLFRTYIWLSVLYIPYGLIYYFLNLKIVARLVPVGLIVGFIYTGLCYHLWYFPAFILGFFLVEFLFCKLPYKYAVLLLVVLYLIGMSETYSAYMTNTFLGDTYAVYKSIFFTTRNGIFYVPIFIWIGNYLYEYKDSKILQTAQLFKCLCAFLLFLLEAFLIYHNQGDDKNFYFSLLPFSLFFFNWISRISIGKGLLGTRLKKYSTTYYFYHPIFIELGFMILARFTLPEWQKGMLVFLFTMVCVHVVAKKLYEKTASDKL